MSYKMTETNTKLATIKSVDPVTQTQAQTQAATAIVRGEALSRGWGSSVSHSSQTIQERIDEHMYGIKGWKGYHHPITKPSDDIKSWLSKETSHNEKNKSTIKSKTSTDIEICSPGISEEISVFI